jgi:hypothetical protein
VNNDQDENEELDMPPIIILPVINMERLTLKFMHSISRSLSGGEPNLSALLEHISSSFTGLYRGRLVEGVLDKLNRIAIELHDIPARCLGEEGIQKDKEMWDRLDGVLSGQGGYVPNVEQLELKLFLRQGESMTEEIRSAASQLLPSLTPTVRRITVSTAKT